MHAPLSSMAPKANRKRSRGEDTGMDNVLTLAAAAATAASTSAAASKKTISANWSGSTVIARQLEEFQRSGLISSDIA